MSGGIYEHNWKQVLTEIVGSENKKESDMTNEAGRPMTRAENAKMKPPHKLTDIELSREICAKMEPSPQYWWKKEQRYTEHTREYHFVPRDCVNDPEITLRMMKHENFAGVIPVVPVADGLGFRASFVKPSQLNMHGTSFTAFRATCETAERAVAEAFLAMLREGDRKEANGDSK